MSRWIDYEEGIRSDQTDHGSCDECPQSGQLCVVVRDVLDANREWIVFLEVDALNSD